MPKAVWVSIGLLVLIVVGLIFLQLQEAEVAHAQERKSCEEAADSLKACVKHALDLKMRDVLSPEEMSDYHFAVHDYVNYQLNTIRKDCLKE